MQFKGVDKTVTTTGGINAITAVDVTDGKLTMDALILQKKIFNMLNRVAITDGTYQAWREATYGIRSATLPESPIFCGGMQSEIAFDEIVSNAATDEEPLGTLAGRGRRAQVQEVQESQEVQEV